MEQIQLPEPQLQPPEIAAAVSNVQDKADMSVSVHPEGMSLTTDDQQLSSQPARFPTAPTSPRGQK